MLAQATNNLSVDTSCRRHPGNVPDTRTAGDRNWGTYNFAGAGAVSWHGFAEAIFELASPWRGAPPRVDAITTAEYPTPAQRPANSVLDSRLIREVFGIEPRPWREALAEVIRELYETASPSA